MPTRLARIATAVTVAAAAALVPAGIASADPLPGPSACDPGHQRAWIDALPSTAEVANYTVTIMADPGTSPCVLSGTPTGVVFSLNGSPRGVDTAPTGEEGGPVLFGDGQPVVFDLHVPASDGPAQANEATFTLGGATGDFVAYGPIGVDAGTTVGPVTSR
jgi:hypothetical protein